MLGGLIQTEIVKDEDLDDLDFCYESCSNCFSYDDGSEPMDFYRRLQHFQNVEGFIDHYKFALGEKICIHPHGPPIFSLSDYCLESTVVGVHGMQSICTVFRRDMDMTRLDPFYQKDSLKHHNMRMFAKVAISEVECLPHKEVDYFDVDFRRSYVGTVERPFAVVSQGLGNLEESGSEDWKLTGPLVQHYLESVVSSDELHTHYGIIRVAIKAYQMCHKELRADDIWVTIMDVKYGRFDHLPVDIIGEQLDWVNGRSSEKDPQKPIFARILIKFSLPASDNKPSSVLAFTSFSYGEWKAVLRCFFVHKSYCRTSILSLCINYGFWISVYGIFNKFVF